MAEMFWVTSQNITLHIKNIYKDQELHEKATCKESLQVQTEGNRTIKRKIRVYNLDVLIAVWYRISSITGTRFRQWATKVLSEHITQWYTINKKILQKNYNTFMKSVEDIKKLVSRSSLPNNDVLELIKFFGQTWFSLDAYDKWNIPLRRQTAKKIHIQAKKLYLAIAQLKQELFEKWEATELFAQEKKKWSIEWILGNVLQTAFWKDIYPSIETKAAHLLYFIVKLPSFAVW